MFPGVAEASNGDLHLHRQEWDTHRRKKGEKTGNDEPSQARLIVNLQIVFSIALLILFVAWLVRVESSKPSSHDLEICFQFCQGEAC
ncbi:MAG: hypothetical protein L7V86_00970 [Verrucomicrobiales bacterium]|nr:hypothetical protein [Verrucomicrobiales bacterium]